MNTENNNANNSTKFKTIKSFELKSLPNVWEIIFQSQFRTLNKIFIISKHICSTL